MKRVGQVKFKRSVRKNQLIYIVRELTATKKGYCTCTDVAKRLGLTASTHLLNLLWELKNENRIYVDIAVNTKGNKVFHWYWIDRDAVECDRVETCTLPWGCPCCSLEVKNS